MIAELDCTPNRLAVDLIRKETKSVGVILPMKLKFNRNMDKHKLEFVLGIPGAVALSQLGIDHVDQANEYRNHFMRDFQQIIHVYEGIQ